MAKNVKMQFLIHVTIKHLDCEIALVLWMQQNPTDDNSALAQVMAWCHHATSHYLSQCWPRSGSPYCITRWYDWKRPGVDNLLFSLLFTGLSSCFCIKSYKYPRLPNLATIDKIVIIGGCTQLLQLIWCHPSLTCQKIADGLATNNT